MTCNAHPSVVIAVTAASDAELLFALSPPMLSVPAAPLRSSSKSFRKASTSAVLSPTDEIFMSHPGHAGSEPADV